MAIEVIDNFRGKYAFLSNFYPAEVVDMDFNVKGAIRYKTVEHAFQAAKTKDFAERLEFANLDSPSSAKSKGRHIKLREDWGDVKEYVMYTYLKQKFSIPELKTKLLETGDAILVEGNTWGDRFWGVYNGEGKNLLGTLLMQVRKELRENN